MSKIGVVFAVLWLNGTATLFAGNAQAQVRETKLFQDTRSKPLAGRDGVATVQRVVRLSNDRALFQLTHGALEGEKLLVSDDQQSDATRREYQSFGTAPTVEETGFVPLGLSPAGNWDDLGFFNFYVNDVGFNYSVPALTTSQTAEQSTLRLTWTNSQATLTQIFALRARDDKLLMRLEVAPRNDVKIERLVLQLRNRWQKTNSVYGNPSSLEGAVTISNGGIEEFSSAGAASRRVDLSPASQNWIVFHNKALGSRPSALMFVPGEVERAHILLDHEKSITTLFLDPQKQAFHFALWDVQKQRNDNLIAYFKEAAPFLTRVLSELSGSDWTKELPRLEENTPLHLSSALRKPDDAEKERGFILSSSHPQCYADANTLPSAALTTIALQATRGAIDQSAFELYAMRDLGRVTLEASTLAGPQGAGIAADNIDVRVVKVWPQQTGLWGGASGEFLMTPELLVRNDTLPLQNAWTGEGTYHPQAKGEAGYITGPAITEIPRDTTRQFWVSVRVPDKVAAGIYRGAITIRSGATSAQVPLTLEVLPFELVSPDERYTLGISYRGTPFEPRRAEFADAKSDTMDAKRFRAELEEIKEIGFNAPGLMSPSVEKFAAEMLPVYRDIGFRGPVTISGWGTAYNSNFTDATNEKHRARIREYLRLFAGGELEPLFYGIDEPAGARIAVNIKRADITHEVEEGGRRGKYSSAGTGDALEPQVGHLDYPVISSYFTSREKMRELRDKYKAAGGHPLYYWQIWGEYPLGNRLNTGFFLYASGYDGIMPYVFRHFSSDPFAEDVARVAKGASIKNMMISYPCNEGSIPTLQGEAARMGIIDLRYLLTLDEAIQNANGRVPAATLNAARQAQQELLKKYGYEESRNWGRMIYGALNWPDHQSAVAPEQFDRDRRTIAEWIVKLQ